MSTDPSKQSQVKMILEHLESGRAITPITALKRFKCMRLAARIADLRFQEHKIKTEIITNANGKRYASYSLENNGCANKDILGKQAPTDL